MDSSQKDLNTQDSAPSSAPSAGLHSVLTHSTTDENSALENAIYARLQQEIRAIRTNISSEEPSMTLQDIVVPSEPSVSGVQVLTNHARTPIAPLPPSALWSIEER
jgi:hypothetical protein